MGGMGASIDGVAAAGIFRAFAPRNKAPATFRTSRREGLLLNDSRPISFDSSRLKDCMSSQIFLPPSQQEFSDHDSLLGLLTSHRCVPDKSTKPAAGQVTILMSSGILCSPSLAKFHDPASSVSSTDET